MKNSLRTSKGITLIALVITIIVLLILVAVTLTALTGQNGILTNSKNAKSSNAYYSAEEQVKIAYMSVRTEIEIEIDKNSSYDATSTSNPDNVTALANIVRKDLNIPEGSETTNTTGYKVVTDTTSTTVPRILITYTNSKIQAGTIEASIPFQNGKVEYSITLQPQSAMLKEYRPLTGIDFGDKTETAIEVGEDFTIGTESFRVLIKSLTQIVAVPHYNITKDKTNPIQSSSAGTAIFTASGNKFWETGQDDINWKNDKCLLKPYIEAYSAKLDKATGGTRRVFARLGKYSEFQDSSIIIPDGVSVTKAQVRNPKNTGSFWLGSGLASNELWLYYVATSGAIAGAHGYYYTENGGGVRPVVVIDI